jgi:hypothetical protein
MRLIGVLLAAGLGLAPGADAPAEVALDGSMARPAGRSGPVVPPPLWPLPPLKLDGTTPFPHTKPPGAAALERPRLGPGRPVRPRPPRERPFLFFPHIHDDDDDDRIIVIPAPPAPPPEAAPAAAPEPAPPPDPRGPAIYRARGAGPALAYAVGEPLPADVPHVALDWRIHGLPEPPPGLAYARVGRDVLLIDPASRVVERRLEPAELAPEGG